MQGYIHVCQKGPWYLSWAIMLPYLLKDTSLMSRTQILHVCIVTHEEPCTTFVKTLQVRWPEVDIQVHVLGRPEVYERATLQFMRHQCASLKSPQNNLVWYMHTKGLRWFGTPFEPRILQWMLFLLHMLHVEGLKTYVEPMELHKNWVAAGPDFREHSSIYGRCPHFAGNFWIARASYILERPETIGPMYIDPEFWLLKDVDTNFIQEHVLTQGRSGLDHYQQTFYKTPDEYWTNFRSNRIQRDRTERPSEPRLAPASFLS